MHKGNTALTFIVPIFYILFIFYDNQFLRYPTQEKSGFTVKQKLLTTGRHQYQFRRETCTMQLSVQNILHVGLNISQTNYGNGQVSHPSYMFIYTVCIYPRLLPNLTYNTRISRFPQRCGWGISPHRMRPCVTGYLVADCSIQRGCLIGIVRGPQDPWRWNQEVISQRRQPNTQWRGKDLTSQTQNKFLLIFAAVFIQHNKKIQSMLYGILLHSVLYSFHARRLNA